MVKSFQDRKRQGKRSFNKRPPSASSVIAEVVSVDADNDQVNVKLSAAALASLKIDNPQEAYAINIVKAASGKQPNLNDLLGKPGGNSQTSMTVGEGSFIRMDNVSIKDGNLSTTWINLAAGPKALASDRREPKLLSGMIRTRPNRFTGDDGKEIQTWNSDVLFPDQAVEVKSVAQLSEAIQRVFQDEDLSEAGPVSAVVRCTNSSGEPAHLFAFRKTNRETGEVEQPDSAAARFMEDQGITADQLEGQVIEVLPQVRVRPGGLLQSQINCEMEKRLKNEPSYRGHGKYSITEIHPNSRPRPSGGVESRRAASEKSIEAANRLAERRAVKPTYGDNPTQGQVSVFIENNNLVLGYAPGDVLVRFGTAENGNPTRFASACATMNRTGIILDAIRTPHAPNHGDWLKAEMQEARQIRQAAIEDSVIRNDGPAASKDDEVSHSDLAEVPMEDDYNNDSAGPSM